MTISPNDPNETARIRFLERIMELNHIQISDDGFYHYFPDDNGYLSAHHLRWIADQLDKVNQPIEQQYHSYFEEHKEKLLFENIEIPPDLAKRLQEGSWDEPQDPLEIWKEQYILKITNIPAKELRAMYENDWEPPTPSNQPNPENLEP